MAHGGGNERETLGKFVRHQSGYGTTVTNAKKSSHHISSKYIKHTVTEGDTLMALSLKYHVTLELLKRENKLWNNDTLFLKEFILIPVTPDNEDIIDPESVITISERDRSASSISNGSHHSSASEKETSMEVPAGKAEQREAPESGTKKDNPLDFLNKYDSNIAKLKSSVAKMKTNAENDEIESHHNPGRSIVHCLGTPFELVVEKETEC
ncbi:lysM and putative peptidoglycan-binding domain-containing protein 1-like isoform X2 [Littorina saxatilis]|uniref:lysM and putative peptidoglycan-binding domain-containing protein 1-like isoform X2 n=1 Tax=Littorina saxatilis TaxID=31220 RepID=UPI0038B5596D